MEKTIYKQPTMQVITCSVADVVTASAVGSEWNSQWDSVFNNEFEF